MIVNGTNRIPLQVVRAHEDTVAGDTPAVTGAVLDGDGIAVVEVDLTGFGPDIVRTVLRAAGHYGAESTSYVARIVRQRDVTSHLTLHLPASAADDLANALSDAAVDVEELNTHPQAHAYD